MRGKKSDPVFVATYIQESAALGYETPDQIVNRAKKDIECIDMQIKEAERLKGVRSKILDVVATFEKKDNDKSEESKLLPFFKLEHPEICKHLCSLVKKQPFSTNTSGVINYDIMFSIKQLIECKVLARVGDQIIRGDRFDEYLTFVLREV